MSVALVLAIALTVIFGLVTGSLVLRGIGRGGRAAAPGTEVRLLGARVESFIGGARWPLGNATYPLARLDLHEYGVRVHGAFRLLDLAIPDWRTTYQEIRAAQPVDAPAHLGTGLRLLHDGRDSWIVFWWLGRAEDLLARLASMGVPVTYEHQKISFWTGHGK